MGNPAGYVKGMAQAVVAREGDNDLGVRRTEVVGRTNKDFGLGKPWTDARTSSIPTGCERRLTTRTSGELVNTERQRSSTSKMVGGG
uniref:Uncharacterized protein n=1 Tax=Cucumis sativus TaxID=3659 RepID=A0A0A0KTN8_CUCSA